MAKQDAPVNDRSFKAGGDLRTKQFYAVKLSAKDTVVIISAATDIAIGILQDKPNTDQAGLVRMFAQSSMAVVDGTTPIAVGDRLGPNSSGKLVKKSTADYNICAIANEASSADGDIIEVFMVAPGGVFRTLGG